MTNINKDKLQLALIIMLIIVGSSASTSPFSLRLSSTSTRNNSTHTKFIPPQKPSSCQLIVFVIYNDTFTVIVQVLQGGQADFLYVGLEKLGVQNILNVSNGRVQIMVKVDSERMQDEEVTEYIIVKGLKGNSTTTMNSNRLFQQQQQQKTNNQFALQTIFQQTRKVYLLEYSQNQWPTVTLPIRSILLTQIIAFILIILLSHNIKYRRFLPINFGFLFSILYSLTLLLIVYIDVIIQLITSSNSIQSIQIPKYMVSILAMCAITYYLMDLMNFYLQSRMVMFGIAVVISGGLIMVDEFVLQDYWYVNDVIAVLVSGCLIKFIVIRRMKTSILPLSILWLFSILRQFIHVQSISQQISLAIFPLHLQIPACLGDDNDGYSCSAFGSSKIIIIGLLVNYCIRIDLFLSSRFYQLLAIIIAFIALVIELVFSIFQDDIPVMEYFSVAVYLPLTIVVMLAFAEKRGEWAIVWHGSFYDMAVNRTSIRKSQKQSISQIDSTFGEGLILAGSQIYSQGSVMERNYIADKKLVS